MKRRICVVGDGGWGTALAIMLHQSGHIVRIWSAFPEHIDKFRAWRENKLFLPGIAIPHGILLTSDRAEAVDGADLCVLAVPTRFFRTVLESFVTLLQPDSRLVSVAKGFDPVTRQRMTEAMQSILPQSTVAALSGPSFAEEVARGVPTAVVVASSSEEHALDLQRAFANRRFRVYTSDDVTGVELGGALKNVIAIAAGINDGIGFGNNSKAALITRGLAEITRLGVALGAKAVTFSGLSGLGDLLLTCGSAQSRNHQVGERLGRGEKIDQILSQMKQVAEGVSNCSAALELARLAGVDAPITEQVCEVIHSGRNPHEAVETLMTRDAKPE